MISSSAVSKLRRRSARMPRICASTITSSAVVGSSAIRTFGLEHERQRDHDPLPHPARELVRVLLEAGRRDPHARERLERASRGPPPWRGRARGCAAPRGSAPRSSAAGRGGSSAPGRSGRARGRAARASPSAVSPTSSRPRVADRAGDRRAVGQQAEHAAAERRLAAARLADEARGSRPAPIEKQTPSTARTGSPSVPYQTRRSRTSRIGSPSPRSVAPIHGPSARRRRAAAPSDRPRLRRSPPGAPDLRLRSCCGARISGLMTSLRPSPSSVKPVTSSTIARPGKSAGPPDPGAGVVDRALQVVAPLGGVGRLDAVAEEAEGREGEDRVGGVQRRERRHALDHVLEHVAADDRPPRRAERPGRLDVGLLADADHVVSDHPEVLRHVDDGDRDRRRDARPGRACRRAGRRSRSRAAGRGRRTGRP